MEACSDASVLTLLAYDAAAESGGCCSRRLAHTSSACLTCRQGSGESAGVQPAAQRRPALSSFMDDDWMFGCQKPTPVLSELTCDLLAKETSQSTGQDRCPPASAHATTAGSDVPLQTVSGQTSDSDRQTSAVNGQAAADSGKAPALHGQLSQAGPSDAEAIAADKRDSSEPWTMSVPAVRSSISFANALPPILSETFPQQPLPLHGAPPGCIPAVQHPPHAQQEPSAEQQPSSQQLSLQQQQDAASGVDADVRSGSDRWQAVDTSVSDWLHHQESGGQPTSGYGVESSSVGLAEHEAAVSKTTDSSNASGAQVSTHFALLPICFQIPCIGMCVAQPHLAARVA